MRQLLSDGASIYLQRSEFSLFPLVSPFLPSPPNTVNIEFLPLVSVSRVNCIVIDGERQVDL